MRLPNEASQQQRRKGARQTRGDDEPNHLGFEPVDFAFQAAYIEPEHIKVAVLVVAFEFIHYLGTTGIDRA